MAKKSVSSRRALADSKDAAHENLKISEQRYRHFFENGKDGILILNADTRKIIEANPLMTELVGYTHDEFIGKELWELGLLRDEAASKAAFAELQRTKFIRYEDLPLKTKDGRIIQVEFVSNLYQEDNESIVQCHIRDIIARKQIERDLAEKARLLDLSNDAIIVRGLDDNISLWNKGAENLFGWTAEEVTHGSRRLDEIKNLLRSPCPQEQFQFAQQHPLIRDLSHYQALVPDCFASVTETANSTESENNESSQPRSNSPATASVGTAANPAGALAGSSRQSPEPR